MFLSGSSDTSRPTSSRPPQTSAATPFHSTPTEELLQRLKSTPGGLTGAAAAARRVGKPTHQAGRWADLRRFAAQLAGPIPLILIFSTLLSFALHQRTDATIILIILGASATLGFWQERRAGAAVARLLAMVRTTVQVRRDGRIVTIATEDVAPGDVVMLSAGSIVPGDCRLLAARDLHVDEAALTGESFPVEKQPGEVDEETPLARRTNCLFLGSHVVSGQGEALVAAVGDDTIFGAISRRLRLRPPETEFERGVRRFGGLLAEVTAVLTLTIFAVNVYFERPVLESFLFALALAVGLTPQLLPAIIAVNLAHGARRMAAKRVIVRRLPSIENFGSIDVLCCDKTGTLTEGRVRLHAALDVEGVESRRVLELAYQNASLETGFSNPIDEAIRATRATEVDPSQKLDEIPYDFLRKRLSVLVRREASALLITKGAIANILSICTRAERPDGDPQPLAELSEALERRIANLNEQGMRVLGVATRELPAGARINHSDERDMTLAGFLVLQDPPKAGVQRTVVDLRGLGIRLKMITGDSRKVAAHVAAHVGLDQGALLTGEQVGRLSDRALVQAANQTEVFAEVEPNQKERIILALKKAGHVVGFVGDGINDASALHAADVGVSVDTAVDVAKEAADIVLLDKSLDVLLDGVRAGREAFCNTMKYVLIATSANFGNMFSMAGASLFTPFLPLLPKQILLLNLLTDLPEMAIASDRVDEELVRTPQRWDVHRIRRFMLCFGLLSSLFDFMTFGLLWLLRVDPRRFRAGWFIESLVSATLIVLVVRTRRPIVRSLPHPALLTATAAVIVVALLLPVTRLGTMMGFSPLPHHVVPLLFAVVLAYVLSAEALKRVFRP